MAEELGSVHHDGAGRPGRARAIVVGGVEAVRRDDQAGRTEHAEKEGVLLLVDQARANDRDGRSVSRPCSASGRRPVGLNFDIGYAWPVEDDPATIPRVANTSAISISRTSRPRACTITLCLAKASSISGRAFAIGAIKIRRLGDDRLTPTWTIPTRAAATAAARVREILNIRAYLPQFYDALVDSRGE